MVAYFVATLCAYQFVRRKLTPLYGLLAAMVMLASSFNQYSYEARPYAFVLAFLGILALGWQRAIQQDKPRSWISYLLILVGGFGMLLSHVLASVAYAALLLTEAIRFVMRRKPDWILWLCLVLPLSACITYLPPIKTHSSGAYPEQFRASIIRLIRRLFGSLGRTHIVARRGHHRHCFIRRQQKTCHIRSVAARVLLGRRKFWHSVFAACRWS